MMLFSPLSLIIIIFYISGGDYHTVRCTSASDRVPQKPGRKLTDLRKSIKAKKMDLDRVLQSGEVDEILKQKDDLLNRLFSLRSDAVIDEEQPKVESDATAENTPAILLDLRIHQLETLDTVLKASLDVIREIIKESDASIEYDISQTLVDIKRHNQQIKDDIIAASFKASNDYLETIEQENILQKIEGNKNKDESPGPNKGVSDVLENVGGSVEKLEESIQGENKFAEGQKLGTLETVVKLDDGDEDGDSHHANSKVNSQSTTLPNNRTGSPLGKPATTIVDSENNQYVLTRAKNPTYHIEDMKMFHDLILLAFFAFILGTLSSLVGLPSFFGYIASGVLLGPPGFNALRSLVQIETIAQFGVLLILFVVGLEFSLKNLRQDFHTTVYGGSLTMFLCTLATIIICSYLGQPFQQSLFLGATLSLSSTTIVIKCLASDVDSKYGRLVMGILVLQDMALGLILALLPVLAMPEMSSLTVIRSLLMVTLKTALFVLFSWASGKYLMTRLHRLLKLTRTAELETLGMLAICFAFLRISEYLKLSAEVGCFTAGVIITNSGSQRALDAHIFGRIESLRDFFGCLFFAAIGIHVYPAFLISQAPLLLALTLTVMAIKTLMVYIVLKLILKHRHWPSISVGVALSQVSEFAFVLASRGISLGIFSKEVYYLVLGVTSLSLLLTPLAWRLVRSSFVKSGPDLISMSPLESDGDDSHDGGSQSSVLSERSNAAHTKKHRDMAINIDQNYNGPSTHLSNSTSRLPLAHVDALNIR